MEAPPRTNVFLRAEAPGRSLGWVGATTISPASDVPFFDSAEVLISALFCTSGTSLPAHGKFAESDLGITASLSLPRDCLTKPGRAVSGRFFT